MGFDAGETSCKEGGLAVVTGLSEASIGGRVGMLLLRSVRVQGLHGLVIGWAVCQL